MGEILPLVVAKMFYLYVYPDFLEGWLNPPTVDPTRIKLQILRGFGKWFFGGAAKPFHQKDWVVVLDIYLGKWSNLTNIFQMGWNHQLEEFRIFQTSSGGVQQQITY